MKRLPLFTLLIALSIVPITSAQNPKREKESAEKNAALARFTQRAAAQRSVAARPQNQRARMNPGAVVNRARQIQSSRFNSGNNISRRSGRNLTSGRRSFQSNNGNASARARVYTPPNAGQINVQRDRRQAGNAGALNRAGRGRGENRNWNQNRGGHRRHGQWNRQHRNRSWWLNHYTRFALFGGGYYYWNAGYWYPAYGYDPYFSTYAYDAPIYAYDDLDPGDIIARVQVELQRRGYDPGSVDGDYGPATREALLNFQEDNGVPASGEIDGETLEALGLQ